MEAVVEKLDALMKMTNVINSQNAWIALYRSKPSFDVLIGSHHLAFLLEQANITYKVRADELEEELSLDESADIT